MKRTYIVAVEVTFLVEASSHDEALDKAHDHIAQQGLNDESIENVTAEQYYDGVLV